MAMPMEATGVKVDRLVRLYPKVDEMETPLPRGWSSKDKYTYIGLSQSNLRVHYKGSGKNHKDAASVRAAHPIPAACGVHYFELRVVSKGRDGYMGIGLSTNAVNLNRLPGWEKNSYGYHADDGCVYSSSGTGQNYGPTFSTGDVVGCGFNLVDRSIFFTKNGITLGNAVSDVPSSLVLYPVVGLQTPGEIVEANFGETPFVFDFEGLLAEMQQQIRQSIEKFTVTDGQGVWQASLHKLVLSYLVHHGYSRTAQVFATSTAQKLSEDAASIRSRQRIQSLVLKGRVSEAVRVVRACYPGLLEGSPELLFRLKCRQFVEMIGGFDTADLVPSSPLPLPPLHPRLSCHSELSSSSGEEEEGEPPLSSPPPAVPSPTNDSTFTNGELAVNGDGLLTDDFAMEVDDSAIPPPPPPSNPSPAAMGVASSPLPPPSPAEAVDLDRNPVAIERVLTFGQDLQSLYTRLTSSKPNDQLKTMLQDSFSLLAYTEPRASPVGYLLDPIQREPVCAALNSAILESQSLPGQPPLEFALGQAAQSLKHMSRNGLGAAAFTGVQDIVNS